MVKRLHSLTLTPIHIDLKLPRTIKVGRGLKLNNEQNDEIKGKNPEMSLQSTPLNNLKQS